MDPVTAGILLKYSAEIAKFIIPEVIKMLPKTSAINNIQANADMTAMVEKAIRKGIK